MRLAGLLLAGLVLPISVVDDAGAARCRRCAVGVPSTDEAACVPNGGILVFQSASPDFRAYWTLFGKKRGLRSLGRLRGRLEVWSDLVDPGVPGFPGRRRDRIFVGKSARLRGTGDANRAEAVAKYADGSTCEFRLTIAFGLGGAEPNAFVCRDPSGAILAEGPVDLQGIRLSGCRRRASGY